MDNKVMLEIIERLKNKYADPNNAEVRKIVGAVIAGDLVNVFKDER